MIRMRIRGTFAELRSDDGRKLAAVELEPASGKWLASRFDRADLLALEPASAQRWLLWEAARLRSVHGELTIGSDPAI